MLDPLRKGFYWLYPPVPKHAHTPQGENMRVIMGWQCFLHFVFFVGMLTQIGFNDMILEVGWGLFAFAVYLTLRELLIMLYMVSLICGICGKIPFIENYQQTALLLFIMQLVFLFLSFWYVLFAYKDYRFAGGIKGKRHGANRLLMKVGDAFGTVVGTAKRAPDMIEQRFPNIEENTQAPAGDGYMRV